MHQATKLKDIHSFIFLNQNPSSSISLTMECPMSWPEPVIPVQSLSESCASTIPDRYVKPLPDRPSPSSSATQNASIPVIDLGALIGSDNFNRKVVEAISDACREWGFFQVVNHRVSPDLMSMAREAWRGFFHQPMEKKKVYSNTPSNIQGYGSRLGIKKGALLDWGDYYYLQFLPEHTKSPTKWPKDPAICKEVTEEYGREVARLCQVLMKLISMSLGLEKGALQEAFGGEENIATMRVNYYPKCPQPDLTLGLSAHSDPGSLTVLLADDRVSGLQVRKDGEWVTVQPIPDAFIVNIGDLIQIVTNSTYKSVEHRVIANSDKERLSLAFFYNPRGDLPMSPVRELVTPECPRIYRSITYNDYRNLLVTEGARGKAHVDSLKIRGRP